MPNGIFVGISTIDVVYRVDEFPAANTKIAAYSQYLYAGGPATNAAIAFRHLGGGATLISAIGRHVLASAITAELERYGIAHLDLSPAFEGVPPIASITVNPAGERNVVSARRARIAPPPAVVDESLLAQTSIVLVDGHPMQACQVWAQAARARGIPVVLDGGSWKEGTPRTAREHRHRNLLGRFQAALMLQRGGRARVFEGLRRGPHRHHARRQGGSICLRRNRGHAAGSASAGDGHHGSGRHLPRRILLLRRERAQF